MPPRTGESQQGENRFSLKQISLASLRMRILPTSFMVDKFFWVGRGGGVCLIREARGASTNSHLLWLLVFLSLLLARAAALLCSTHDSVLESDSPVSPPNITDAWEPDLKLLPLFTSSFNLHNHQRFWACPSQWYTYQIHNLSNTVQQHISPFEMVSSCWYENPGPHPPTVPPA